jgi:hypothetical protein
MDLLDSSTNALIGRIIDKREDRDTGYIEYTNSITNRADAQRIMGSWARILRKALDDAHEDNA